jgi:hypothetical protein
VNRCRKIFLRDEGPCTTFISSGYWGPSYNETGMTKDATEHLYVPVLCSKRKEGADSGEEFIE